MQADQRPPDETLEQPEPGLLEFLSARARQSSDTRLAIDAAGGVVVLVVVLIWRPSGWLLLASIALCFAAYGAWGISDRELGERGATGAGGDHLLRLTRTVAAALGATAAAVFLLRLLGLALGTWIS